MGSGGGRSLSLSVVQVTKRYDTDQATASGAAGVQSCQRALLGVGGDAAGQKGTGSISEEQIGRSGRWKMKEGPGQDAAAGQEGEECCVKHACCHLTRLLGTPLLRFRVGTVRASTKFSEYASQ